MSTWVNDDGLTVKFGAAESTFRNIGAYSQVNNVHTLEILVDHSELPTVSAGATILNDNFTLPTGAVVEKVTIMSAEEAFDSTSDNMTLSIGVVDADDRTTNAVKAAFVDAATQTELNAAVPAGTTNDSGWAGSLLGTALDEPRLLTWEVDNNDASAGKTTIRIEWTVRPKNAVDSLVWAKS